HTDHRWVGTGRTVFNNKGNPVKQYEPFFSGTHEFETEDDLVEWGVTPIIKYDSLDRVVRTDFPDRTFSKVEFDSWRQEEWDQNDTVLDSGWYAERNAPSPTGQEPSIPRERAAWLAAQHAGTPTATDLDTLGRPVRTVANNRIDGVDIFYEPEFRSRGGPAPVGSPDPTARWAGGLWWTTLPRLADRLPPYPHARVRLFWSSVEQPSGSETELESPLGAEQTSRDADEQPPDPGGAPGTHRGTAGEHPPPQEVECEDLDEEGGLVGVETAGGDAPDREVLFELSNGALDRGARVVAQGEVVGIAVKIVGDEELHGVVDPLPKLRLPSGIALRRAHGDHSVPPGGPVLAAKVEHGDAPGRLSVGAAVDDGPVLVERRGSEQLGCLSGFDDDVDASAVERFEPRATIAAGVDSPGDDRVGAGHFAQAGDPAREILDSAVAHAGVPWTQSRTKNRVELGDASEDRMVAGATVVPGVGAEARAFLATEQRHHGRIDVHRDCVELGARDWAQALLGHESLQCLDGVLVEAGEILVDGVDARDGASGEVLENWVWRQAFEVEYALRAGCSRIDQQLQLGVHGVDD